MVMTLHEFHKAVDSLAVNNMDLEEIPVLAVGRGFGTPIRIEAVALVTDEATADFPKRQYLEIILGDPDR